MSFKKNKEKKRMTTVGQDAERFVGFGSSISTLSLEAHALPPGEVALLGSLSVSVVAPGLSSYRSSGDVQSLMPVNHHEPSKDPGWGDAISSECSEMPWSFIREPGTRQTQMMAKKNDARARGWGTVKGRHSTKKPHCHFCHQEAPRRSPQREETPKFNYKTGETPWQDPSTTAGVPSIEDHGAESVLSSRLQSFQVLCENSCDATPLTLTHSMSPSTGGFFLFSPSPGITGSPSFVWMLCFCHPDLSAHHDTEHPGAPSLVLLTSTCNPAINFPNSGHSEPPPGLFTSPL